MGLGRTSQFVLGYAGWNPFRGNGGIKIDNRMADRNDRIGPRELRRILPSGQPGAPSSLPWEP